MKKYFVLLSSIVGMMSLASAFAGDHSHTTFHSHDGYISHSHGYWHGHNSNEEHGEIDWHSEANGVDAVHENSKIVEPEPPLNEPHTHSQTHSHGEFPEHTHTVNHHNHATGANHPFELFHVYPNSDAQHQASTGIVDPTPDPPPKPKPVPPPPAPVQYVPEPQTEVGGVTPPVVNVAPTVESAVTTTPATVHRSKPPSSSVTVTIPPVNTVQPPVVPVPQLKPTPIETPKIEPIPIKQPPRRKIPRPKPIPIARKWHIDVTEIMIETFSKGEQGLPIWIEVYNKGDKAYSLKGWRIVVEFEDERKDRIFKINKNFVVPKGKARLLVNRVDEDMKAWLHDKQSKGDEAIGGKNGDGYNSQEDHRVIDSLQDLNVETFTGDEKHPINAMTFILRDNRHKHPTGGLLRNNVWKLQTASRNFRSANRRDVFTYYPKHHIESTEQQAVDEFGYIPRNGDYSQSRKSISTVLADHPLHSDDTSLYTYGHDEDIGSPTFHRILEVDIAPAAPSLVRPKLVTKWAILKQ